MTDRNTLFFEDFIRPLATASDFVRRMWLERRIEQHLDDPSCRYVLLTAEPGAGKTVLAASLAVHHPQWLRYFIRRDSVTALSGGDAQSFLFVIGHQLATLRPSIFEPELLELVVRQRVGTVQQDAVVTGITIDDLRVSPFYRTAFNVQQDVETLRGVLTGIEIRQASIEPRLEAPETLQYLALLDPAAMLKQRDPNARIVIVIDGLDEVEEFRSAISILNWLESGPELPGNVRFVLTSRLHPCLDLLRARRRGQLLEVRIDPKSPQVAADLHAYALSVFDKPDIARRVAATGVQAEMMITDLIAKADGNFAYLAAYGRALRSAIEAGHEDVIDPLLRMEKLPAGLTSLYRFFLKAIKRKVQQLGRLEVERPASDGDRFVPAWEGVGQRLLGPLAVARDPMTLDQLMAFGGVRVWRREASNVLLQFVPFLDERSGCYQLFHSSLAEELVSEETKRADPDDWIDPMEWHRRILQHYRGRAKRWNEVAWTQVDDYGLLHIAEHLLARGGDDAHQLPELIGANLRLTMRRRFHTDLPFRRTVDATIQAVSTWTDVREVLCTTLSLALVRLSLREGGERLTPAVLALLARLGRAEEALAHIELMTPSQEQFVSLCAVLDHMDPALRDRLAKSCSINRVVTAALDVPGEEEAFWLSRSQCIMEAAKRLAPLDIERALRLASLCYGHKASDARDAALRAAALSAADPDKAVEAVGRLTKAIARTYLDLAEQWSGVVSPDVQIGWYRNAAASIEREEPEKQLELLGLLAKGATAIDMELGAESLDRLRKLGSAGQPAEQVKTGFEWLDGFIYGATIWMRWRRQSGWRFGVAAG